MKLKDIIDSPCGIRYMFDTLPLSSGFALSVMMNAELLEGREEMEHAYAEIRRYMPVHYMKNGHVLSLLRNRLCNLKDVFHTLDRVSACEPVDDIELFEVKHLVMTALDVKGLLSECAIEEEGLNRESLEKVLSLLDPDGMRIDSFYVFDSYSLDLAALRRELASVTDIETRERLMEREREMEAEIRGRICAQIAPFTPWLKKALEALVQADISMAKGEQILREGLCFPELTETEFRYEGMFHPYIRSVLRGEGKKFTGIDLSFGDGTVLIIGANMGGKTVVLKMLTQCQYLCRLGMGIPAERAEIALKKDVFFISGDAQNISSGLSSFAAEMKRIDEVVRISQSGTDVSLLALVDEPARSTNPIEGTALVEALIELLSHRKGISLVLTTHYNIASHNCRRYRVRGFDNGKMNYRLCIAPDGEIPKEALAVAEALEISPVWLSEAKKLLKYD